GSLFHRQRIRALTAATVEADVSRHNKTDTCNDDTLQRHSALLPDAPCCALPGDLRHPRGSRPNSTFVGAPSAAGTFETGDRQAARPPFWVNGIKRIPVQN